MAASIVVSFGNICLVTMGVMTSLSCIFVTIAAFNNSNNVVDGDGSTSSSTPVALGNAGEVLGNSVVIVTILQLVISLCSLAFKHYIASRGGRQGAVDSTHRRQEVELVEMKKTTVRSRQGAMFGRRKSTIATSTDGPCLLLQQEQLEGGDLTSNDSLIDMLLEPATHEEVLPPSPLSPNRRRSAIHNNVLDDGAVDLFDELTGTSRARRKKDKKRGIGVSDLLSVGLEEDVPGDILLDLDLDSADEGP